MLDVLIMFMVCLFYKNVIFVYIMKEVHTFMKTCRNIITYYVIYNGLYNRTHHIHLYNWLN